ncbi:MAG: hypothetical protein M1515_02805 [Candidatus Thermoplasmatota archaeon]|nr:hypothetical protein [Candidatus Thermoplasmatota archaeon]
MHRSRVMMRSESETAAGVLKQPGAAYPERIVNGALTDQGVSFQEKQQNTAKC